MISFENPVDNFFNAGNEWITIYKNPDIYNRLQVFKLNCFLVKGCYTLFVETGIISGSGNNEINPIHNINRAELAMVLYNLKKR